MTLQEFTDRTGFYPDNALYKAIEAHYINFNGDKDGFCKAYKENTNRLAERVQCKANADRDGMENRYIAKITRLTRLLDEVWKGLGETLKALDKELDWKPYRDFGTSMSQDEYDELMESCTGMDGELKAMSGAEAKRLVAEEFAFSPDKIEIVDAVHTYEINGYRELRKAAEYKRQPLYDSSEHNYIRFNVRGAATVLRYEMINGVLEEYCC